jgi:hypothetical protein
MKAFNFDHDGRTFECTAEKRTTAPTSTWWWFAVSRDQQRYAPFEVAKGDTEASVKKRIIAYYDDLLWRRAQPVVPRQHWARRGRPPGSGATPAVVPPVESPEETD